MRDDYFEVRQRKRRHTNHADTDIPARGVVFNNIQSILSLIRGNSTILYTQKSILQTILPYYALTRHRSAMKWERYSHINKSTKASPFQYLWQKFNGG
jgi:hypothetical protein